MVFDDFEALDNS